jgi:hypothetical protein
MGKKNYLWGGEKGRAMLASLIQQMPAIIAESKTGRCRETGEILIIGKEIRDAAAKRGFVNIPKVAFSNAVTATGAKPYNFSGSTRRYAFEGMLHKVDVIEAAITNIRQYAKQEAA